ncbi:MAG: dihydrofolate reductase family protein [Pseudomonadota bacterium]|nr:dihydrofolate reductase family protein [Pseudomonadota bacterium]
MFASGRATRPAAPDAVLDGDPNAVAGWPCAGALRVEGRRAPIARPPALYPPDACSYATPVTVLSRSLGPGNVPEDLSGRVEIRADAPRAALERAAAQGMARVYVDGGALIRSCLAEGLLREIILTRLPAPIGAGRPLFGPLAADLRAEHLETRAFASGLVQSRYRLPG